jgi:hypothetical protein
LRVAGQVALGLMLVGAAPFPYSKLPSDLPERRPGLWEIRTDGALSSGPVETYEERSRVCLDAAVDRVLYRSDLDAKHMSVAMMDGSCEAPVYAFDGKALSMTMQCTSRGVEGGPRAETSFTSTTTYASPDKVTVEHRRVDHDHLIFDGESINHEIMRRIGDCEPDQKAGYRIRINARINGSESQKSMLEDNILEASRVHRKVMGDILEAHRRINESGL